MALSFSELKKQRSAGIETLSKEIEKLSTASYSDDTRYWEPTVDKAGNGMAVIRFLPAPEGEDTPFVRYFSHGFKGPTGLWYIENCLSTLGQADPVSEFNSQLWNQSSDDNSWQRKQARDQKRKLSFVANILVVDDKGKPENNGKVFLYRFGKKIFDKIQEAITPPEAFADEAPFNPFDMWEGANFKLKIRKVEGYRNFDKSEFDKPSPISNDDDEMESIWKKQYSLQEIIDPKNFKSYDELKAKLARVLNNEGAMSSPVASAPAIRESVASEPKVKSEASQPFSEDDDVDIEFFKNMVSED